MNPEDIDSTLERITHGENISFRGSDAELLAEAIHKAGRKDIIVDRKGKDIHFYIERKVMVKSLVELTPRKKETLELPGLGKPISEVAAILGEYYSDHYKIFYDSRQRAVVKIGMIHAGSKEDGGITAGLDVMKKEAFITFIEQDFDTGIIVRSQKREDFVRKSMGAAVAGYILESEEQFRMQLPLLSKVFRVPMPILSDNKLAFPKKGYDETLASWLPYDAPDVKTDMSLKEARELIDKMLSEFCFAEPQDKINAIAALLTPMCRGLYVRDTIRPPVFFYMANRERAGKDYLAGITGIVYEGAPIEDPAISSNHETHDDEFRKKVFSTLKVGRSRIHSSNNKGFLNSAELERATTAEVLTDRVLGKSDMLQYPNLLEISLSANNGINYTSDLEKRCVFINLFLAQEDPNSRQFNTPNLHDWVVENRGEILSALFAFVRTWTEKGMPSGTIKFASFHEWARVIGGILETCEIGMIAANSSPDNIGGDRENEDMKLLYEYAYAKWPESEINKQQIYNEMEDLNSEFSELFGWLGWDKNNKNAKMRFGKLLRARKNRIYSGIRLEVLADKSHSTRDRFRWTKNLQGQIGLETAGNEEKEGNEETMGLATSATLASSGIPPIRQKIKYEGYSKSVQNDQSDQTEPYSSERIDNQRYNDIVNKSNDVVSKSAAHTYLKSILIEAGKTGVFFGPELEALPLSKYTKEELKHALQDLVRVGEVFETSKGNYRWNE